MTYIAFANQRQLAIDAPRGIDETMYVSVGGIDQWIQIRGQDRDNPVLLWLNGGPGFSMIPETVALIPWEKNFTVVIWDQRGEGKTFERSGRGVASTMTIDRMVRDGIEVAEYLRDHLKKEKVILLGHSWGSILGIHMIERRPDLFFAYVGTGQNVNLRRGVEIGYPLVLAKARAEGNGRAVSELEGVGPPPYPDIENYWVPIAWENRFDGPARSSSILALLSALSERLFRSYLDEGAEFSQQLMLEPMLDADMPGVGTRFEVPIFFFQGADDIITPTALARDYFDRIEAPRKEFVLFPNAGYFPMRFARDGFLNGLTRRVRPLAVRASNQ